MPTASMLTMQLLYRFSPKKLTLFYVFAHSIHSDHLVQTYSNIIKLSASITYFALILLKAVTVHNTWQHIWTKTLQQTFLYRSLMKMCVPKTNRKSSYKNSNFPQRINYFSTVISLVVSAPGSVSTSMESTALLSHLWKSTPTKWLQKTFCCCNTTESTAVAVEQRGPRLQKLRICSTAAAAVGTEIKERSCLPSEGLKCRGISSKMPLHLLPTLKYGLGKDGSCLHSFQPLRGIACSRAPLGWPCLPPGSQTLLQAAT